LQNSVALWMFSVFAVVLTIGNPTGYCRGESGGEKSVPKKTYLLNASILQFAGPAGKDVVYRYCTDEGVHAYSQKDFSKAEDLFSTAVSDAEKRKIQGPLLATMLANLASAQREQEKLLQSRNTFRLAVAALSNSPPNLRSSINFTRALNYIAPQYAALLRKLGRENEAKFMEESPLTLLVAREDQEALTGRVEKSEASGTRGTRIAARAEKSAPIAERAEKTDLDGRTPFGDDTKSSASGSGGGRGTSNVEAPTQHLQQRETVTIRQTTYWEGQNMYDALKAATYYQNKGIDVTVILDRLALQVANRHDMHEVSEGDRLVPVKNALLEFLQNGGTVLASQTWANKLGYATAGNLPPGIRLLSDDEMRDELFKRRGTIIEY